MSTNENGPWGEEKKPSWSFRLLVIIFFLVVAFYFWKLTVFLVVLVLILIGYVFWSVLNKMPSIMEPEQVDPDTGEKDLSFYMGGDWTESDPPYFEDCVNAWMFMLSDAEEVP